jgi:thiol-activated cytolysin
MKSLFVVSVSILIAVTGHAQIQQQKKVIKPTAYPIMIKGGNLSNFNSLKKAKLAPFRISGPGVQKIKTISGPAGGSSTTISRTPIRDKKENSNASSSVESGRYCTSATVSEANGDYEKIVLGNQNDKIFPGAIYTDNAVIDGSYNAPPLRLKPYQITTNLFSAASTGSSYVEVQPSMGEVYDGIGELMRRNSRVINAGAISIEVKNIYSADQLAFFLQAGFQGYGVDLTAEFDYTKRVKKNVIFAKLKQVYFSVTLNRPVGASLIENSLSSVPNNLVYVNKVNYGRIGILKIESDSSVESVSAALDFTYNANSTAVSVNSRLNYQKILANSTIEGFFFGGDAANIVPVNSAAGLSQFNDYVRGGLRLDPNVSPTAVSYELKYINDNATAAVNSTTTYTERRCETAKGLKIILNGVSIEDIHGGDCSYAWGSADVEVYELNERGVQSRRVWPVTNNLREERVSRMWDYPRGDQPQRGMINYASIRGNQDVDINNINRSWTFMLDPAKVATNSIAIVVKTDINTNHKDNDFAALGFHGMKRVEARTFRLNEVLVTSQELRTRAKYGSMIAGPYPSYSGSDRQHNFRTHFTVTTAN